MRDHKYIELLFKEADGTINDQEKLELEVWLAKDEANQEKAGRVQAIYERAGISEDDLVVDIDEAYEKLQGKIKPKKAPIKSIRRILAFAASFVLLVASIWFLGKPVISADAEHVYEGPLQSAVLPDGTNIWLEKGAHAIYTSTTDTRKLHFRGKGYFVVAPDVARPFQTSTDLGEITVLGTGFEVQAVHDLPLIVRVDHGRVAVRSTKNQQEEVLEAGDQVVVNREGSLLVSKSGEPIAPWRLKPISFDKDRLSELIRAIEDVYPISIAFENQSMLNCEITFTLTYPSLSELVAMLEALLNIEFNKTGPTQYLAVGQGCE